VRVNGHSSIRCKRQVVRSAWKITIGRRFGLISCRPKSNPKARAEPHLGAAKPRADGVARQHKEPQSGAWGLLQ
jgi:hypothetical protein